VEDYRACGFKSPAEPIDLAKRRSDIKRLLNRPRVLAAMRARAREERRCLLGYLEAQGFFERARIAVIDLGWNGSIQKALHAPMRSSGKPQELFGYYLATMKRVEDFAPDGFRASGFLTKAGQPASMANTINSFSELLEFACSSASGSLWYFEETNGAFLPRFKDNSAAPESLAQLAAVHDGATAFAENFLRASNVLGLQPIPPRLASEYLLRVMSSPTKRESDLLGALAHCDDMGSSIRRQPVARFREASSTAEELLEDFRNATWKAGLRNHCSPRGLGLRAIHWLLED
jgi:hypothetical protein